MTRFAIVCASSAISLLVVASSAHAADCLDGLSARLVLTEHDGSEGFFVATRDMACVTTRLELVQELNARIGLLSDRMDASALQIGRLLRATSIGTQVIESQATAIESAVRLRIEAENSLDAWHRSPVLWWSLGIVSAVVIGGVGAWLLGAL